MERKSLVNQKIQDQAHACYVLITCGHPTAEGKMKVEMTYEGDPNLAAYLLQNAQDLMDHEETL